MKRFLVLHSFKAEEGVELSVCKGEYVAAESSEKENGWIIVFREGRPSEKGFVPVSYLKEVESLKEDIQTSGCGMQDAVSVSTTLSKATSCFNQPWVRCTESDYNVSSGRSTQASNKSALFSDFQAHETHRSPQLSARISNAVGSGGSGVSGEKVMLHAPDVPAPCGTGASLFTDHQDRNMVDHDCSRSGNGNSERSPRGSGSGRASEVGFSLPTCVRDLGTVSFTPSRHEIEVERLKRQRTQSSSYIADRLNSILTGMEHCRTKTVGLAQNVEELVNMIQKNQASWKKELTEEKDRLAKAISP